MKRGTIIGIVIGLIAALLVGGIFGVMAMRIYMLEDDLAAQTVQEEILPVEQPQPQQPAAPQVQQPEPQQPQQTQEASNGGDAEIEVSRIRAVYNDTVAGMNAGRYTLWDLEDGIQAYYDGEELKCVVVSKGTYGVDYSRWYYYEGGQLIFAYYENEDAHRFYFYQGELMRWRYSADAENAQQAVNTDWGTDGAFLQWENIVATEGGAFSR